MENAITQWIHLLCDLRHYRPEWLSRDLIAGLSVTAVQIPTGIAYANLAGFPPIDSNREMRAFGFANLAPKPCRGCPQYELRENKLA